MLGETEIVERFLGTNLQVHPDVVRYLRESDNPSSLFDEILTHVPPDALVVLPQHIPDWKPETDGMRFLADPHLDVIYGKAVIAKGGVDFRDFIYFFKNRYEKLAGMLKSRGESIPISALTQTTRYRQVDCTITGMVVEVRNTGKGHRMALLEDPTDTINVLFNNKRDVFEDAEKLIPDEVILVKGQLSNDGNLFFASSLHRPDIPMNHAPFKSETPGKVVMISDVHVGSDTFLTEAWNSFSDWLPESDARYLLIAGDLVDGIGIYPGQEKELTIPDIYDQYDAFGEMLSALPSDMEVVISPGNHDAVRGAEPQPALAGDFIRKFPDNVTLVENPAMVNLQGVRVLLYHGRSYDDMISMIPGATYSHPEVMMQEMLIRRNLTCTYGMRTPIFPAKEDRMIIDPIPEILLTGHVHISRIVNYRGVLCINPGTWQSQTSFQKQMNIQPTPAMAVVVDLQTLKPEVFDFSGDL